MKGREESVGRPNAANEGEQIIRMNNERFTVPELLFNPSDIGIEQESVRKYCRLGWIQLNQLLDID